MFRGEHFLTKGFLGTTSEVAKKAVTLRSAEYLFEDLWLGEGLYFFDRAPGHAYSRAQKLAEKNGDSPIVLSAKLHLKRYLNLSDEAHCTFVSQMIPEIDKYDFTKIENYDSCPRPNDFDINNIDSVLIGDLTYYLEENYKDFGLLDGIRSSFSGGEPLYNNSWLLSKACEVIFVRNVKCLTDIKKCPL